MGLSDDLAAVMTGEVLRDAETLERYSTDASVFRMTPRFVVFPADARDLCALVRYVSRHRTAPKLSLTTRAGGTDMTGGPLSTSIVIDVARHLTGIGPITSRSVTVRAGTPFRDLEQALARRHLLYPAYPASKAQATVGGMVANNSGGEKTLRYGKTERYVRSVTAVLADGQEHTFQRLKAGQVAHLLHARGFEGKLYRTLVPLLRNHAAEIARARPKVTKNSTGYALWNAYDPKSGAVDLAALFVGSQGTLGIMTEVTLGVVPAEPASTLLVVYLHDGQDLGRVSELLQTYRPTSIELYDDKSLELALQFAPQLIGALTKDRSLLELIAESLPDLKIMLLRGVPKLVLLAEFTGTYTASVQECAQAAELALNRLNIPVIRTRNHDQAEKYWTIRRQSFNLLRTGIRNRQAVPIIDDLIVPPDQLSEFLPKLQSLLAKFPDFQFSIAGHVGDGNLHVFPIVDMRDAKLRDQLSELAEQVYDLVTEYGGSLSAEHNDGLLRGPYLQKMYPPEILTLFRAVKAAFDPKGIFNPGKKLEATLEFARAHLKHDNVHTV